MEQTVIDVQHLSKSFSVGAQQVEVLRDISFAVNKGDFTVIFGPSGCGKSTLLHTLLGLEVPTKGEINVLGTHLYNSLSEDAMSDFRKKAIGMVYQQPNWISALRVLENVEFPLLLLGDGSSDGVARAANLLDKLQMTEWANYFPTELSSGQQQKVALARALITNPELIIADEPTGNLDFASGQELMELLSGVNKEGKTIIMVTHDLEYTKYAKQIIEMFDGRIVKISNQKGNWKLPRDKGLKRVTDEKMFDNSNSNKTEASR